MKTATFRPGQIPPPPSTEARRERTIRQIKWLIWTYLVLVIFEGALRKWILPQFSNFLLIIRDPVAILIYALAIRARIFPRTGFIWSLTIISILSWIAGILVLLPYLPPQSVLLVTTYGFRSNFLHLPLIFILPLILDRKDLYRIGWWTIVGMIPMAVLMAAQFRASPESFLNRTAGVGEATQIQTSGGKIRAAATFSFVSGAIFYLSTAAAFLLHAALSKLQYKSWLLISAGLGLIVGVGVSGSRGAVLSVALVVSALGIIMLIRPSAMTSLGRNILIAAIVAYAVTRLPVFREGVDILSERFADAAGEDNAVVSGLASRVLSGFVEGVASIQHAPLVGYGLGIGTNGGARLISGRAVFLLAENEWSRILLESGPILGLAFLVWRTVLACKIGYEAVRQLSRGNTLPIFLFMAAFFALLDGPFGQPNSVGFIVSLSGLCLAAARVGGAPPQAAPARPAAPAGRHRRSAYASRLHQPAPPMNRPISR